MRYRILSQPTDGVRHGPTVDAAGVGYSSQVIANAVAIPTGNYLAVLQTLVNKTVQPNAAQLAGLNNYLGLIQAGTATTTVETAITALL